MSDHFGDVHQILHSGNLSDHLADGEHISTGIKNAFSDHYFMGDGSHESVYPDAAGGKVVYHDGQMYERVVPDGHGSHNVYDGQMHLKATIGPEINHGHTVFHDGLVVSSQLLGHGASTVMHYSDPLLHLSEYSMTKLVLG